MRHVYFFIVLLFSGGIAAAQDTLWAQYNRDDIPFITIRSKQAESIYSIARKYSVPPGFLSDLNDKNLKEQLAPATTIKIPVGSYNYRRVYDAAGNRPVFYKVRENDKLYDIARAFNTSQQSLQQWNHINGQDIAPGKALLAGWVSYDASADSANSLATKSPAGLANNAAGKITAPANTPLPPVSKNENEALSAEELAADSMQSLMENRYYEDHSSGGSEEESGAAVFFESNAPAKPGVYYAFHNMAKRGSIVRVHNPDGDKTVYVKVIGKIPELKEYHNCIIAISDDAAKALGAPYKRTFCRISY